MYDIRQRSMLDGRLFTLAGSPNEQAGAACGSGAPDSIEPDSLVRRKTDRKIILLRSFRSLPTPQAIGLFSLIGNDHNATKRADRDNMPRQRTGASGNIQISGCNYYRKW